MSSPRFERVDALEQALERRAALLARLAAEGTDCLRLLHGAVEGAPGLAVDRYGPILLVQTWREPLEPGELDAMAALVPGLIPVWNHRRAARGRGASPDYGAWHQPAVEGAVFGREQGLEIDVRPRHRGADPLIFVDLRAGRRAVRARSAGRSVLNLFAYTCGVGLAAAAGGALEVCNVDFAASALDVGRENARRNNLPQTFIHGDALPILRQWAGSPPGGRRGKVPPFVKVAPRTFDLVVLDPPRWAASPFGAVDVVNDYPSLLKPALQVTAPGGAVLATNHVASVSWDAWMAVVHRCAEKVGRPIRAVERLMPDDDLPSPDGNPPLKLAWLGLD